MLLRLVATDTTGSSDDPPSKARVTSPTSHRLIGTQRPSLRNNPLTPISRRKAVDQMLLAHTHIVKDHQSHMPRGTSPLQTHSFVSLKSCDFGCKSFSDFHFRPSRRILYWRRLLASTGLANFFSRFTSRIREPFTVHAILRFQ